MAFPVQSCRIAESIWEKIPKFVNNSNNSLFRTSLQLYKRH